MLHDALFVLWDCSLVSDKPFQHGDWSGQHGDKEMYGRICDIARSHHRVQSFVNGYSFRSRKTHAVPSNPSTFGLYSQALSEGMEEVLHSYKQSLREVEREVLANHSYGLSFVYGQVERYRGLFNTLNRMISSVKERRLRGCQILSLVHQHILSGSEVVRDAILKVFAYVNKVFVSQLCSWLLYGELKDPYQEFFIYCQQDRNDSKETVLSSPSTYEKTLATSIRDTPLDCGCTINTQLLPHFIPLSLAQDILFIGRTVILFGFDPRDVKKTSQTHISNLLLLQKCSNSDSRRFTIWDDKEAEFHETLQRLKDPNVFEVSDLRLVINEIKVCVTKHLWTVTVHEARLLHELRLLKDFYLLGRGELFLELLRLSSHTLDSPARTSTRELNRAFHLAARAVQLAGSADLDKFSLELPYVKPQPSADSTIESETTPSLDGWSSVILKYDFKWPLHLLFTPEVLARYNDMFRLLLRIKKTQHDLHALWKDYKQRSFSMCQLHNKLMFLMDNLQHYLQADVLETNFSKLLDATERTEDFEELKRAHATFLADVLSQSFLTVMPLSTDLCVIHCLQSPGDSICEDEPGDVIDNPVFYNIMDLLKLCHSFCSMSQTVADQSSEAYLITGYTERFDTLVSQLLQLLTSLRTQPCGAFLARLLMRLDYNRWFSSTAHLTQSVTSVL